MRRRRSLIGPLLLLFSLLGASQGAEPDRVRFYVTALKLSNQGAEELSRTSVEGPAGTDFSILFNTSAFRMNARFLTDWLAADRLRIRARLETRRHLGTSPRGLPLYEEDLQHHDFEVTFDEGLAIYPFGDPADDESLRIEIVPDKSPLSPRLPDGAPRPLEIKILRPSPAGAVAVRAWKVPHDYTLEAELLQDDRRLSNVKRPLLLEEPTPVTWDGLPPALRHLAASFQISDFRQTRHDDQITLQFNLSQNDRDVVSDWTSIGGLGQWRQFDLPDALGAAGLRLRVRVTLLQSEPVHPEPQEN